MNNTTKLGPRPSDPSKISFDRSCFKTIGTRTVYTVIQSSLKSGPKHFGEDKAAAEAFAKKCNRSVNASQQAIEVRISWTAGVR